MGFRGVFVGIDRHSSPQVQDLTCAARDATALAAVFEDTLGGACTLLTDAAATRCRIVESLEALATSSPDDTVVIAFSGHGSEDHRLVAHDSELGDLDGTALPLAQLEDMFTRIPAKRLLLVLDCCFSGGIGAKVLKVEAHSRDAASVEERLSRLAGEGRVILTASAATQPAWEHVKEGHGLLSRALMQALTGAPEVVESGRISLLKLLAHVARQVDAAASGIGKRQTPTVRGSLDGDLHWPVFIKGPRWEANFPTRPAIRVTEDLGSLVEAGFPQALVAAWAEAIPSLNRLQVDAINDYGLLEGDALVVSAPTSSGKTMVGELAALRAVLDRKRAIFLLPLKALVADKHRHFLRTYAEFGVRTIEATGETDDIAPLLRGKYDIALLTYEKFSAIALLFPHVLEQAGAIVVDEAQMIADVGRGANLEFLLTLIRMRSRTGVHPQLIALSAVIGDTNGLEDWMGARLLRRQERPVPLDEGLLLGDGRFRHIRASDGEEAVSEPILAQSYRKGSSQDWIIPLVRRLVEQGQQVIVFREQKGQARGCAGYLAETLGLPPASQALDRLPPRDPSRASQALRSCLGRGVSFHHSDLTPEERRVVEEEFRRDGSGLRVIAATTTLAMGINTPASSVVICGLQHPGPNGPVPYSVAEYKNLVGRAGRLGYSERGTSYLLALTPFEEQDLWHRYVTAAPEDLISRFLHGETDTRTLIVRVIASASDIGGGMSADDVVDFLEASFGAFVQRRLNEGWAWNRREFERCLHELEHHGLVEGDEAGKLGLTELGRIAGQSGIEVVSVIRLVAALEDLPADRITDPALVTAVQATSELDDVYLPMNRKSVKSHHKEPQAWTSELIRQGLPSRVMAALQRGVREEHMPTLRAKKAVAALLFVSGRPMDQIEQSLLQFGGGGDGAAGAVRSVANRTCDVLPAAGRIAELVSPGLDLGDRIERLLIRLTHGVSSACVDLARECGAELSRGDYRALELAGYADPDAAAAATDSELSALLATPEQVTVVRDGAARAVERRRALAALPSPVLEAYEA